MVGFDKSIGHDESGRNEKTREPVSAGRATEEKTLETNLTTTRIASSLAEDSNGEFKSEKPTCEIEKTAARIAEAH